MTTEAQIDTTRTYTVAEFMALPDDGKEYELIKGELVEMRGPSFSHGRVINSLVYPIRAFLEANPIGDDVSGTAFVLSDDYAPRPDVAFVLKERLTEFDHFSAFPGPPDLAVEVLSRTDIVFDVNDKVKVYLEAGVKLVWVINPRVQTVEIFRPGALKPQVLDVNDELDGETLLPGFKLKVSRLFE